MGDGIADINAWAVQLWLYRKDQAARPAGTEDYAKTSLSSTSNRSRERAAKAWEQRRWRRWRRTGRIRRRDHLQRQHYIWGD